MSIHITRHKNLWFWSITNEDGKSVENGNCLTIDETLSAVRAGLEKANGN